MRQVIDSIVVDTVDKQRHSIVINFSMPFVNDKLRYKITSDKSEGYVLVKGSSDTHFLIDTAKQTGRKTGAKAGIKIAV